jgi:hypothetical protein
MMPRIIKELFKIKKLDLSIAIFIDVIFVSVVGSMAYPVDPVKNGVYKPKLIEACLESSVYISALVSRAPATTDKV